MGARRGNGISLATAYVTLTADGSEIAKAIGQGLNQGQKQATSTGRAMGKAISDGVGKQDPLESLNKAQEDAKRKAEDLAKAEKDAGRRREDAAAKVAIAKQKVKEADERAARAAERSGRALDEAAPNSSQLTAYDRLRRAQNDYADEVVKTDTNLDGMRDAQEKANKAVKDAEQAVKGAESSTEKAGGAFSRMADRIKAALHGDFKGAFKPVETEAKESADKAEGELDSIGDNMEPVGQNAGMGFGRAFMGAIAALGIGAAISSQIKTGFESASDQQNIQATVAGLYGDADKAAGTLQKIKDLSKTSPIDYKAYGDAAGSLAYAGVEGEKAVTILDKVGWAIQGAGGGAEELDRAMNGILKGVNNGGIVMNDTLGMISESGYPIINGLQEKFNTTGDVIKKMASKGEISIEDVLSVMENGTGELAKKQEDAGKKGAEGFSKQWATLKDNVSVAIGETLIPLLEKIAPMMKPVGDALVQAIEKIKPLGDVVVKALGFLIDNPLVLGTIAAGITAMGVAAGISTGAFKALGTAIWTATGPVGLIIAAITAAVAALVWFFTKTELGQKIISKVWGAIKVAISAVVDWFTGTAWPALKAAWDAIATAAMWLWQNALQPAWNGIKTAISVVVGWIMNTAVPFLKSAWDMIATAAKWLYEKIIKPVWNGIKTVIAVVAAVVIVYVKAWVSFFKGVVAPLFQWLYAKIIKPVWDKIKGTIAAVVNWFKSTAWPILKSVIDWIKNKFTGMKNGISAVFSTIKNKIINPVVQWFKNTVWPIFKKVIDWIKNYFKGYMDALKTIWSFIKNKVIAPVVNWFRDHVWPSLKKVIDHLKNAFGALRDKISAVWSAIKLRIVKPVVDWFMATVKPKIDTFTGKVKSAFNTLKDGVLKAWNKIKDGMKKPINGVIGIYNKHIAGPFNTAIGSILGKDKGPRLKTMNTFATGGYTGAGAKYQPAGVVHADEFVVKKSSRRGIEKRAPGFLDALNTHGARALTNMGLGYASGGRVLGNWKQIQAIPHDGMTVTSTVRKGARTAGTGSTSLHALGRAVDFSGPAAAMKKFFNFVRSNYKVSELIHTPMGGKQLSRGGHPRAHFPAATERMHYNHVHVGGFGKGETPGAGGDGGLLDNPFTGLWKKIKEKVSGAAGGGVLGSTLVGSAKKVVSSGKDYLKNKILEVGEWVGDKASSAAAGVGKAAMTPIAMTALKMEGEYSQANLRSMLRRMEQESTFNPAAINKTDVNAQNGDPSKGVMQVIGSTFRAYKRPGFNNIWAPLDNMLASIRYTRARYGSLRAGWGVSGGYANGGYTGPGSKWAPAGIVHADEHVIRRESRASIERVAPGFLDRLNTFGAKALGLGGYAKGGKVGYAKGGRVSKIGNTKVSVIIDGLTGTEKQATTAVGKLADGIVKAFNDKFRASKTKTVNKLTDQLKRLRAEQTKLNKVSRQTKTISQTVTKHGKKSTKRVKVQTAAAKKAAAQLKSVQKQIKQVDAARTKAQRGDFKGAATKAGDAFFNKYAKSATAKLTKLAKKSDTLTAKLKDAKAAFSDIKKERADYKSSITDKFRESYGLTEDSSNLSVKVLVSDYKAATKSVKAFQKQLSQLKKKGLNVDLVDSIAQMGVESGSAVAGNILGGSSKDIKALSSAYKSFNKATAKAGTSMADSMYKDGVNGAKGLVKGLNSQLKAVEKSASKLANKVTKTVRKKLKIHSPSRVMADLGSYTGQGFVRGVDGQAKAAQKSLTRLTAVPSVGVPQMSASSSNTVATRGDGQTIVNVQRGNNEDPTRLGRRVAETLDLYRLSAAV